MKNYMSHKQWIYQRLNGLVLAETKLSKLDDGHRSHLLGTLLVIIGGLILYSDKVMIAFNLSFQVPQKFADVGMDFQTYIWLISQTVSPVLIIAGAFYKAYHISYLIPLYCYSLQLFLIFFDYKIIDDSYIQVYAIGTALLTFAVILLSKWLAGYFMKKDIESAKEKILLEKKNALNLNA